MRTLVALVFCAGLSACQAPEAEEPGAPAEPARRASLVGRWDLRSVLTETRPRDGSRPVRSVVHLAPGDNNCVYTAKGTWQHVLGKSVLETYSYRLQGDSLFVSDSARFFPERIVELTATRLVTVSEQDRLEGPLTVTTTSIRAAH